MDEPELTLDPDPWRAFAAWYAEAEAQVPRADAMALATVDAAGRPSLRMVLYKGVSAGGLRFYTNLESRKAHDLAANPQAALLFHWQPLHRQIRVEGRVERLPDEDSDAYFASRDREARLSAWASPQSEPIASRRALVERIDALRARFGEGPVPRPDFWGGYRLVPERFEFWQGRDHRLHDRLAYERADDGWRTVRLAP